MNEEKTGKFDLIICKTTSVLRYVQETGTAYPSYAAE